MLTNILRQCLYVSFLLDSQILSQIEDYFSF